MEVTEEFPNDKKRWISERKIVATASKNILANREKQFLIDSFMSLPIEKQKEILNFRFINPFDNKQPESEQEAEYRYLLRDQDVMVFKSEIII